MDLGTTNVKGIIMDEDGNIVASASRANELILPGPGMAEQDAGLWWEHSAAIMRELTQKAGAAIVDQICGVCISSQTVTMLPLDASGNVLRNAIIWIL